MSGLNRTPKRHNYQGGVPFRPRSARTTRPQTLQGLRCGGWFLEVGAQLVLALQCRGRVVSLEEQAKGRIVAYGGDSYLE